MIQVSQSTVFNAIIGTNLDYKILVTDALTGLRSLASESVHCVVTSIPYWGLRVYDVEPITFSDGWHGHLGLEPTIDLFVAHIVEIFNEIKRVLRYDGTCWLNIGDCYGQQGKRSTPADIESNKIRAIERNYPTAAFAGTSKGWDRAANTVGGNIKQKDLCGQPWACAFALRASGWYLRSEIVWCLSGGTYVYAKTKKGATPMMVKDVARLDPATVQLWNGQKWTQLLGMSVSSRADDEIEIVLRSGERISCTPNHKFPTNRGLLEAKDLVLGDEFIRVKLPEPENVRDSQHVGVDIAWFIGLYLAEGSRSRNVIQIAGHSKEVDRWIRLCQIVKDYGGTIARTIDRNKMDVRIYSKVLNAFVDTFIEGKVASNKCFTSLFWQYSNEFLDSCLDGYLHGDGHFDLANDRIRLGFARNYNLERDLRVLCARLGYSLTLNLSYNVCKGKRFPSFRGEIRKSRSEHFNNKSREEIVELRKARCRQVWDLGVADEPHLFSLASGILTHNSKPNALPESVRDRPSKAHETIFLLAKSPVYYYDRIRVQEPIKQTTIQRSSRAVGNHKTVGGAPGQKPHSFSQPRDRVSDVIMLTRNRRTVWNISNKPYHGAHFATFPLEIPQLAILAGTSEKGCCNVCLAPWKRVLEPASDYKEHLGKSFHSHENDLLHGMGQKKHKKFQSIIADYKTIDWVPTCKCARNDKPLAKPVVLDPFVGSGTSIIAALQEGCIGIGIELSSNYAVMAKERIEAEVFKPRKKVKNSKSSKLARSLQMSLFEIE